ncbi:hypothetical protein RHO15_08500 [Utexia brackfieldae]|uniref:hypothetical protein n=1 Tax=Utexia brackfieldae TaxID=3074108 RepID=UPI00370D5A07
MIPNAFNLCSTNQDLYYSLNLYDKNQINHPELKKVILYFSVFSTGYDSSKTSERDLCVYFKNIFDIEYQNKNIVIDPVFNQNKKIKIKNNELQHIESCFIHNPNFIIDNNLENRVQGHLRENRRLPNQIKNLLGLIKKCKTNGHELIIILPPARSEYKHLIEVDIFNEIHQISQSYNLKIIDLFNYDLFTDDDFGDSDHVNINGANKLTNIAKNEIS